eukprot:m.399695 g.399695  ORF g.399695 m.399695 type:complete len:548 (+) comp21153_c1_seq2:176-1819(+)
MQQQRNNVGVRDPSERNMAYTEDAIAAAVLADLQDAMTEIIKLRKEKDDALSHIKFLEAQVARGGIRGAKHAVSVSSDKKEAVQTTAAVYTPTQTGPTTTSNSSGASKVLRDSGSTVARAPSKATWRSRWNRSTVIQPSSAPSSRETGAQASPRSSAPRGPQRTSPRARPSDQRKAHTSVHNSDSQKSSLTLPRGNHPSMGQHAHGQTSQRHSTPATPSPRSQAQQQPRSRQQDRTTPQERKRRSTPTKTLPTPPQMQRRAEQAQVTGESPRKKFPRWCRTTSFSAPKVRQSEPHGQNSSSMTDSVGKDETSCASKRRSLPHMHTPEDAPVATEVSSAKNITAPSAKSNLAPSAKNSAAPSANGRAVSSGKDNSASKKHPVLQLERQTLLMEMLNGTAKPTKEEEHWKNSWLEWAETDTPPAREEATPPVSVSEIPTTAPDAPELDPAIHPIRTGNGGKDERVRKNYPTNDTPAEDSIGSSNESSLEQRLRRAEAQNQKLLRLVDILLTTSGIPLSSLSVDLSDLPLPVHVDAAVVDIGCVTGTSDV